MLLEDILEEYMYHCQAKGFTTKTLINKRQEYKQLKNFLKEKRAITELESITTYDLRAYIRVKQKDGLQPQSIVSMFKMIKAFFSWCEREEYLKGNITKKVEVPKVPKKVLNGFTASEVEKMIEVFTYTNYLETRNKAIIAMLADCGLRAMEIRGLLSVNVKETSILVNGKGNKERIVFISPALKRILIKYERIKKQYFLEKDLSNNYFLSYIGTGISHVALDNIIKEAGRRAGIEGKRVSPHTFRHFYAVQCLTQGNIDVYSLSRLLGHSDITVTQRYLHTMNDEQLLTKAVSSSPLMNLKKS
ncbi:tyrosine-type recombinase/integrase [Metabacillus hrfriensis]|uniref:Tyrosine-type recombinase/integrase n=1 Tax=Metabacillus hrfriensis TaxID=3048891 RepID=A0ACD4RI66_9BACI|nr:tyrosine-type recombinase/integrase [Metabacillus sp. CT-WN-B3]WHZ60024.1 tyrosine-type recombinase/integrase [Metabacillus sp. CT-WN-B3]